ncbi:hypothetical protein M2140_001240 [Clostridiales Family XIII bacterium PM5-7]
MRKSLGKLFILVVIAVLIPCIFVMTTQPTSNSPTEVDELEEEHPVGMFSWEEYVDTPERAEALIDQLSITRWYQEIDFQGDSTKIKSFINGLSEKNVTAYALFGSVDWGYEKDGKSLIAAIKEVSKYNESAEAGEKISGIMVDVEPYTSSRWKKNTEKQMKNYVSGMIAAYQYGKEQNLNVAVCIPRHYDDQNLTEELERLIAEACDEVVVMNYDCGREIQSIATEAALAEQYGKTLHCILEFQRVGKHGLTEDKTYRNKGIDQALLTWDRLDGAFPRLTIVRDYHWTKPIEEMLEEGNDGK